MKQDNVFTWKIGGDSGQGQQIAGLVLAQALTEQGYYCFSYSEFSSRLRSGLATNQVSISPKSIKAGYRRINLLFALNQEALDFPLNSKELADDALVFYDKKKVCPPQLDPKHKKDEIRYLPLSLDNFKEVNPRYYNILVLGISSALFKTKLELLNQAVSRVLGRKDEKILEQNKKAAQAGWKWVQEDKFLKDYSFPAPIKIKKNLVLTANDALCLGAVASDCKFYSAYPMTPASSILHTLAKWSPKSKMLVLHPEDEIAAINLAIGASWAGARAMTGTSGGGLALMNEGFCLTGMSETPLVVVDAQRPGPSTGMATWTEQGDLEYTAKTGYGEFPRIILAPSDSEDAFYLTSLAFNLADKYQTPVVILVDKYISSSYRTTKPFDWAKIKIERGKILDEKKLTGIKNYYRYSLTKDGISPRSLPGQKKGMFLANGNEHDKYGLSIDGFSKKMRRSQMEKRQNKIKYILKDLPKPELFGPQKAKITLVGWGSVKGPVLEALKSLNSVNYLHIPAPWPLDNNMLKKLLKNKKAVVIENNYSGQLANLMQEVLGQKLEKRLNKYDGQQFWPEEIVGELQND